MITLLCRSLALLPEAEAQKMAVEVGAEYGRKMAETLGPTAPRSLRAALHTVADALSSHGFDAHSSESGTRGLRLISEHCPFGNAPMEHPVICAVDRGMITGMLGALYGDTTADTPTSRPLGDANCITFVEG